MTKKFDHPLMVNNITRSDRYAAANFIKNNVIFTQSKKVIEFENPKDEFDNMFFATQFFDSHCRSW
jgi:hypothetical protein